MSESVRATHLLEGATTPLVTVRRVLLLKPGVTSSREELGDYEHWFGQRCGALAELTKVELHAGERLPRVDGFDGVIMTGSPLSVIEPAEWMQEAAEWMLNVAHHGTPVLGVCFGHQLLAWALGGRIVPNPRGRELGTVTVHLTPEGLRDPLLQGLPARFEVQATHDDVVQVLPPGATVLATNPFCTVQAFAHGPAIHGVQFHPEMDAASIRYCIRTDPRLDEASRRALDSAATDSPFGAMLLQNFVRTLG